MVTRAPKSQKIRAMVSSGKGGFRGGVAVVAWLAAACAPLHPPAPADGVPPSLIQQGQQVPEPPGAEIFSAGLACITE